MGRSPLLPIFLIVLVDILGLTIILPLLPFYAESLGASPFVVGLIVATYAACQLVAGPIIGRISDRYGRKPLLFFSQLGTFVGFLVLAGSNALWMVFLSRAVDGITAGNLSLAQAYIADVTAPEDRARSFGVIGIAFGIGFLIGPGISGWLAGYGYPWPILLAAALSLTSILATTFLLPGSLLPSRAAEAERRPRPDAGPVGPGGDRLGLLEWGTYLRYFRTPGLSRLLGQFAAFAFAFATFTSGFALFAERRFSFHPSRLEVPPGRMVEVRNVTGSTLILSGCSWFPSQQMLPGEAVVHDAASDPATCPLGPVCIDRFLPMGTPHRTACNPLELEVRKDAAAGGLGRGRRSPLTLLLRESEVLSPWGTRQVGYLFAYAGLLGIILQGGLIGRLVKRFGEPRLVRAGFLSLVAGYLGLGESFFLGPLLASATVNSFGHGVLRPAVTALITQRVSRAEQGVVLGLTQSLTSIAQIVGPLLAGALIDGAGSPGTLTRPGLLIAWACLCGLFAGIGLLLSWRD